MIPVAMDDQGMIPSTLEDILQTRAAAGLPAPRVIYVIPSGQNPTGAMMGPERRAEVYEVCRRHNLVIVEDDAYSWLQYPDGEEDVPGIHKLQREWEGLAARLRGEG